MFVTSEDEIYVLVTDNQSPCFECNLLRSRGINTTCGKKHLSTIARYEPELNLWEDVSSFDLGGRQSVCIVTKGNFIYFIGGRNERKMLTGVTLLRTIGKKLLTSRKRE